MDRLAAMMALVLLFACATESGPRWHKPGTTPEELQSARADCMDRALVRADPSRPGPQNRARVDAEFERCMTERGWTRTQ